MNGNLNRKKVNKRKAVIIFLLLFGFMALEFPGILIVGRMSTPVILGVPFLYTYIFFGWVYMVSVMFYGFKTSWGKKPFFKNNSNC